MPTDPLVETPRRARSAAVRVRKWGPDLVIRVPSALARDLGLYENDVVDVRFRKRIER